MTRCARLQKFLLTFCTYIGQTMCCSSEFACAMIMVLNLSIFFITSIVNFFLACVDWSMIHSHQLLLASVQIFIINYFYFMLTWTSVKPFHALFTSPEIMFVFFAIEWKMYNVNDFSGSFPRAPIILSKDSAFVWMSNLFFVDFWSWLYLNILLNT